MPDDQSLLPGPFSGEVRLFPLPDFVLFPSNVQPLHIFEERYCEMFEDALQGDRLIAIATLQHGREAECYGRPAVSPIICIGQVYAHESRPNGTFDLLLVGLRRAEIKSELPPLRPFRTARVRLLDDDGSDVMLSEETRIGRELSECVRRRSAVLVPLADKYQQGQISLAVFTDVVAFHCVDDVRKRLELLATTSVAERAKRLLQMLAQNNRVYPPRFSAN